MWGKRGHMENFEIILLLFTAIYMHEEIASFNPTKLQVLKLTEHCKPTIMEKIKSFKKNFLTGIFKWKFKRFLNKVSQIFWEISPLKNFKRH